MASNSKKSDGDSQKKEGDSTANTSDLDNVKMLLKYIKNQSVREEVGEWLPSSFPCLNCNECWILMSISPEEPCRYCGCAVNQHLFLISREEDVSCIESEQETISFEKGSSVYGVKIKMH